jgi:hypothetical protein
MCFDPVAYDACGLKLCSDTVKQEGNTVAFVQRYAGKGNSWLTHAVSSALEPAIRLKLSW